MALTDTDLDAIRVRVARAGKVQITIQGEPAFLGDERTARDRAVLLAEVDRLRAEAAARVPEPSAYVNGDNGSLTLRCGGCDEYLAFIEAGDGLAGLNAEASGHSCAAGEVASGG